MKKFSIHQIIGMCVIVSLVTSGTVSLLTLQFMGKHQQNVSGISEFLRTASGDEASIVQAVAAAEDAVVNVIVSKNLPVVERTFEQPFEDFGVLVPQYRQRGMQEREVGGGTAFFISEDGMLLTNKHVVDDLDAEYTVLLNDERRLPATVLARDPGNDIALLQVEGSGFKALKLADTNPMLGQRVIAIGNSLGEFRNTVSVGVVSGLMRSISAGNGPFGPVQQLEHIIQTDAAINQGNSGGPLINTKGEVLGMSTAVAEGAQNIGFAIPSEDLKMALESYEEHGSIQRALLGVRYIPITPEVQQQYNIAYDYGVFIARTTNDPAIVPGSAADEAGLQENDIILAINDEKLVSGESLAGIIRRMQPGEEVQLSIARGAEEMELTATLQAMTQ